MIKLNKLVFYYLIRDKIRYELIILLFLGTVLIYQNSINQYGTIYSSIFLSILYTVYFQFMNQHKNRINLFYKGSNVKKLKCDTIKAISVLSLSLFLIAVFLDLFVIKTILFSFYHLLILLIFILSTLCISINIEKDIRKNDNIISFKEGVKTIGIGIGLTIIMTVFLQFTKI